MQRAYSGYHPGMNDEAVVERLSRLEGSLRRTQRIAAALGVALCVLITVAAMQGQGKVPDELRVKKLIAELVHVMDRTGDHTTIGPGAVAIGSLRPRGNSIVLTTSKSHASIRLLDGSQLAKSAKPSDGVVRSSLAFDNSSNSLRLYDSAGKGRIALNQEESGAHLVLSDGKSDRARLGSQKMTNMRTQAVTNYPESTLSLWSKDGELLHHVPR